MAEENVSEARRKSIKEKLVQFEADLRRDRWPATDFVQDLAHDLNTPLNVIMGMCQLLERDPERPLSSSQQDAVDRIDRNAHALLKTIRELLGHMRSGH